MVQYYFSQSKVVSQWGAPSSKLFETQSAYVANKTYVDLAKNYTTDLSTFMRDYYSIHHWFIVGHQDYISYYKGVRSWIENELNFVEKAEFKAASLEVNIDLCRIWSLMAKLWATTRQSSRWATVSSSMQGRPPLPRFQLPDHLLQGMD